MHTQEFRPLAISLFTFALLIYFVNVLLSKFFLFIFIQFHCKIIYTITYSHFSTWLYNICRGIDLEAVTPRFYSKSIGCCKKFPGRNNISGLKTLKHWLKELANEINERLEKDMLENNRRAKQMVINFVQEYDKEEISSSRSAPLQNYDIEDLANISLEIIKSNTKQFFRAGSECILNNPIKFLGISVGKFETISNSQNNIQEMFALQVSKMQKAKVNVEKQQPLNIPSGEDEAKSAQLESDHRKIDFPSTSKQTSKDRIVPSVKSFFFTVLNKEKTNHKADKYSEDNKNNIDKNFIESTSKIDSDINDALKPEDNDHIQFNINNNSEKNLQTVLNGEKMVNDKQVSESFDNDLKNARNILKLNTENQAKELSPINNNILSPTTNVECILNARDCDKQSDFISDLKYDKNEIDCNSQNRNIAKNSSNEFVEDATLQNQHTTTESTDVPKTNIFLVSDDSIANRKRKFLEVENNDVQVDYRHQYAEYAIPELLPEYLEFISCFKCGAKVFNEQNSIQTHQDLHLAQELSQQQRTEFRNELQTKINSSKLSQNTLTCKKSKKVSNTSVKKSISTDITKFLKPQLQPSTSLAFTTNISHGLEDSNQLMKICERCKMPVKIDEILEHNDFHVAKNLQRQLNQLEVHTVTVAKKVTSDNPRKNLNSSANITSHQSNSKIKPITQFFTQSNS